ncbi:MAG: hypothetical protein AMXMBFR53_36440 [Gemmatimonadota bacterium]
MSGFLQALPVTLRFEGGYANHPNDPGGATNKGITQATYDAYRTSLSQPVRDVREIGDDEVGAIYHRRYWLGGKCDALPWPVSLCHFDACVNHGLVNAAKILQRAINVPDDGKIGPQTLGACDALPAHQTVNTMLWERLRFYERITLRNRKLAVFLLAWLSRVNALRDAALRRTA